MWLTAAQRIKRRRIVGSAQTSSKEWFCALTLRPQAHGSKPGEVGVTTGQLHGFNPPRRMSLQKLLNNFFVFADVWCAGTID